MIGAGRPEDENIIRNIKTSKLIPYERNPRRNDKAVDEVVKSIQRLGYKTPIIIDENFVILCGHTRFKAIKKLGWSEIPFVVQYSDLDEAKKNEYRIRDNKTAELAEWDFEILEEDFSTEELTIMGFDIKDLSPVDVEEDEAPPLPTEARTVLGDIYQLGNHRVMCGDSTLIDDVEKLTNGQKVDMLLTDPPYNVDYHGGTKDNLTIKNDSMDNESFREFLKDCFINADTFMKQGAVFYIWHADLEGYNFRGACKDAGWKVRQCLIWNKSAMVLGRQDYHWKHEPCLYGWKDGASHLWAADRKQTTVIDIQKPNTNKEHPTMKPVALFAYQLQNNTKGEDIILDLFGGSGTTIIAAEETHRIGYLMELDPKYCDVIVQRWVNLTGGKVIRNGIEIEWKKNNE